MSPLSYLPTYNPVSLYRIAGLATNSSFPSSKTPPLTGKIAVITGGQAGIGREITAQLLLHDIAKVYILGRSEIKYDEAKRHWHEQKGLARDDVEARTEFVKCDLSDIRDVKRAADLLLQKLDRLHMLFNNAGLPPTTNPPLSPQSLDLPLATNHLGHYVLTLLLLPLLRDTTALTTPPTPVRIITTSSSFHLLAAPPSQTLNTPSTCLPSSPFQPAFYTAILAYGRSKLANILFTTHLAALLRASTHPADAHIYANAFNPGPVASTPSMDAWRPLVGAAGAWVVRSFFGATGQTEEGTASTALFLGGGEEVVSKGLTGGYWGPMARWEGEEG
ncbi:MAG: hypothetical protein M1833_002135, partial [Piccolia ochrophora]